MLTPATSYYWVILLSLPLVAGRTAPLMPVLLAALVYGHEVMSGPYKMADERFYALSWCMAVFFALWLGRRASQIEEPPQERSDSRSHSKSS